MRLSLRLRPALVLAAALLAACGGDVDPPAPDTRLPPRVYLRIIAEMGLARAQLLPDTTAYRIRIGQILATYEVTTEELRAFATGYAENEDVLASAYALERSWLDSLYGSGIQGGFGSDSAAPLPGGAFPADTLAGPAALPGAQPAVPGAAFPGAQMPAPVPAPVAMDTFVAAPAETTVAAPADSGP